MTDTTSSSVRAEDLQHDVDSPDADSPDADPQGAGSPDVDARDLDARDLDGQGADGRSDAGERREAADLNGAGPGAASTDQTEDSEEDSAEDEEDVPEPSESDLFRQSEIAADYIEGLLDILDFDGDIDELVHNGRPMVEVVGARLNNLVGTRGATLEALQELSRLAVYRRTGGPSRLLLDVGGFRASRRKELGALAKNAAERVKQHGELVRLEPMSAFERKCVHDVINAMSGVESESEGVEPSRRIVIRPRSE